jgi:hypothetical protein
MKSPFAEIVVLPATGQVGRLLDVGVDQEHLESDDRGQLAVSDGPTVLVGLPA